MSSFRWLAVVALSLGGAGLAAQDKGKDKAPTHTSPYFPLAVGATWTYRAGEATFSYRVGRFEEVSKTPTARLEMLINNQVVSTENIGVTKDGVARFKWAQPGKAAKEAKAPIRILPLELKEGDEWVVDGQAGDEKLEGKFVLSGVKERHKVRVGDRQYDTVVVTGKDLKVNGVKVGLKYYFAEHVGMVKQELEVAGNKLVFELERYDPPEAKKGKE